MANSVSKISINVGVNATGVVTGMNQAASAVNRGMANIQQISQAATFAVDDFFAAFSTGGLAGGLRGAGNNLTQIASMLGGIKTQLFVIGALAVGQLIAKQFASAATEVDKLRKAMDDLERAAASAKSVRELARELAELQLSPVGIGATAGMGADEVAAARERNRSSRRTAIAALREQEAIAAERSRAVGVMRSTALFGEGHEHKWSEETRKRIADAERESALADAELAHRKQIVSEIDKQAIALQKLARQRKQEQDARQLALEQGRGFQPFITSEMRSIMAGQLMDIDDEIASINASRGASFRMSEMFSRFGAANAFGSSGAVSAINAAQFGPQNARDAGSAVERQQLQELRRLRELQEKRSGIVEVIGL